MHVFQQFEMQYPLNQLGASYHHKSLLLDPQPYILQLFHLHRQFLHLSLQKEQKHGPHFVLLENG